MSNGPISDDDLNFSANSNNRLGGDQYADQISVAPVRGVGAIKQIFAPENRFRLTLFAVCGLVIVGAVVWAYTSVPSKLEPKGGTGKVNTAPIQTQKNLNPTEAQREEADRYNQKELPTIQQQDPYAHPVVVVEDDQDNPFHQKEDFQRPKKISEAGRTSDSSNIDSGKNGGTASQPRSTKDTDDFIVELVKAEGTKSPQLNSVNWSYRRPVPEKEQGTMQQVSQALGGGEDATSTMKCKNPATRAATEYLATADIAINSDVGGPISLTLRNGRLVGSRILGSFERKEQWLRMDLKKLVTKDETLKVEAIGLDMETTLNAVAGDLDNHTLYRYGWWGFGSVLKAAGKAAQSNADQSIVISNGTAFQTTTADASRELKIALGSLGEDLGDVMRDRLNRPPTVSLKVGDEVGVFFLDDVCLTAKPKEY
jgi:hypothetical protein